MEKIKAQLDHIRFFINEDFKSALNCFNRKSRKDNNKAGCFSLLRIIFPLIDHVAQLVEGKSCKRGDSSRILKKYIHRFCISAGDNSGQPNFAFGKIWQSNRKWSNRANR